MIAYAAGSWRVACSDPRVTPAVSTRRPRPGTIREERAVLVFIARRLSVMPLKMIVLTFVVFRRVNLEPDHRKPALEQNDNQMSVEQVDRWISEEGYRGLLPVRHAKWLGSSMRGEFGRSTQFRKSVNEAFSEKPSRVAMSGLADSPAARRSTTPTSAPPST